MGIRMLAGIAIAAVSLLPTQTFGQIPSDLEEKGRGTVRYLNIIKIYDAALYASPSTGRADILDSDHSRCLVLTYALSLSAADMIQAAEQILAGQHKKEKIEGLRSEIDQLHRSYQNVGAGDRYHLCYDSTTLTTELSLNDQSLIQIASAEFARLYFGIWLGENSIDQALQQRLLAGLKEDS